MVVLKSSFFPRKMDSHSWQILPFQPREDYIWKSKIYMWKQLWKIVWAQNWSYQHWNCYWSKKKGNNQSVDWNTSHTSWGQNSVCKWQYTSCMEQLDIPVLQKSRKTIARLWDRDWSLETATLMRDCQKYDILENELLHNNFILPEYSRSLWWNYIH